MSEGYKPASESVESFTSKKERVVAFIEEELKKAEAAYESLNSQIEYYRDRKQNRTSSPIETPTSIPPEVLGDGGSDLSDWRVEMGADRYEDQQADAFLSSETESELSGLYRDVENLKEDLEYIKGLQSETTLNEDYADTLNRYLALASKSA